jgi:hypothetical protein
MAGWNNFRSMVSGYEIQGIGNMEQGVEKPAEVVHEDALPIEPVAELNENAPEAI